MQDGKSLPLPKDVDVEVQLLAHGAAEDIAEPALLTQPLLRLPQPDRAATSESHVAARDWPLTHVLDAVNNELPSACIDDLNMHVTLIDNHSLTGPVLCWLVLASHGSLVLAECTDTGMSLPLATLPLPIHA